LVAPHDSATAEYFAVKRGFLSFPRRNATPPQLNGSKKLQQILTPKS
jgi:hypothetical protein